MLTTSFASIIVVQNYILIFFTLELQSFEVLMNGPMIILFISPSFGQFNFTFKKELLKLSAKLLSLMLFVRIWMNEGFDDTTTDKQ